MAIMMAMAASALSITADDQVTFTRHAYDDGGYLFSTFRANPDAPLATLTHEENGDSEVWKYVILSENVETLHQFSLTMPSPFEYRSLFIASDELTGEGGSSMYINEIIATQYLFNDDDLYEVIFYDPATSKTIIYNEKGERIGEMPEAHGLYLRNGKAYLYAQYDENGPEGRYLSALYSINKPDSSVATMKSAPAELHASPNPVKEDEMVTLVLPENISSDMTVEVYSLTGSLLLRRECKKGESTIQIPAYRLSNGMNPVVVVDSDGNVLCSGKVVKE